jgi:hypothetical protein
MSEAEEKYIAIGEKLHDSVKSNMFGKSCFKTMGKPYICYFQESMVFKLEGKNHEKAMAMSGAQLFDPSGKGRPMREWVQLPAEHSKHWESLAKVAQQYVQSLLL